MKGDPRDTIKALATEQNATAVVVGRRGSVGAVKRYVYCFALNVSRKLILVCRVLLGSVSDYLAKNLDCTVIIVKGE